MIAMRNVLLNGQHSPLSSDSPPPTQILFPEHRGHGVEDTLYRVVVESVSGAPTTAVLRAKFQVAQTTTGGFSGSIHENTADRLHAWGDASWDSNPDLFPDGPWPTVIADETTSGLVLTRRIRGGSSHRLVMDMAYTGGASGVGDTTNASGVVLNAGASLLAGMFVTGPGIAANTKILTRVGTTLTLSRAATATATGVTLTASPAFILSVESTQRVR